MYEAVMRISANNTYANLTAENDTQIMLWCSGHCDLLYLSGEAINPVISQINETIGVQISETAEQEAVVLTERCPVSHDRSFIDSYLRAHSCFLMPPLQYLDGEKRFRFVASSSKILKQLYRDLIADDLTVEVESKREITPEPSPGPVFVPETQFPSLTSRQRETLSLAVEMGYYELPRGTSTEEISSHIGVSRRTVETHLRRAEQKIIQAMLNLAPGYFDMPVSSDSS